MQSRVVANRKRYALVELASGAHLWFPKTDEFRGFPIAGGGNAVSDSTANAFLDTLDALAPFIAAHTGFPGTTGANEVAGVGSARQPVTYDPAAGRTKSIDVTPTPPAIPIPAGNTVAFLGGWSLVTVGTFRWWMARAGGVPAPFTTEDSNDLFTCDQHGYADTQQVFLTDTEGAVLPGGFVEGTIYFVRDATTDTFKLALTSGGAAIDVTADGAGFVQSITPQTYSGPGLGSEVVNSGSISLTR